MMILLLILLLVIGLEFAVVGYYILRDRMHAREIMQKERQAIRDSNYRDALLASPKLMQEQQAEISKLSQAVKELRESFSHRYRY